MNVIGYCLIFGWLCKVVYGVDEGLPLAEDPSGQPHLCKVEKLE